MRHQHQNISVKFLTTPVMANAGRIIKMAENFNPDKQDQLDCNLHSSFSHLMPQHQYDFIKAKTLAGVIDKLNNGQVLSLDTDLPTMYVDKEFVVSVMTHVKNNPPVNQNHKDFMYRFSNSSKFSHLFEVDDTLWIFGNYFG